MAIADGGELIVLAPGVATFGEDPEIDRLIRKYGYRTTPEIMRFVEQTDDLPQEPLGGRPPDPRLVGRAIHDHLLPRQAQPGGDRVGRLPLRRPGADAPPLRSQNSSRRLERAARRRADLLRQQSGPGALGVSRTAATVT